MRSLKGRLLSCLLVIVLVFSLMPSTVFVKAESSAITSELELREAIEAIPAGGSGEITVKDVYMFLSEGLYIENKDVTFNLINASLITAADPDGFGQPVIFGFGANITINIADGSSIEAQGHTGNMGVVRIDNSTDWNEQTQTFPKTFTLTVNGGRYLCTQTIPADHEDDLVFAAASGTKVVLTDVVCYGAVKEVAFEGVGITVPGELTINSGKFSDDVREYAADGKYICQIAGSYYVRDKEVSDRFLEVVPGLKLALNYAKPTNNDDIAFLIAEDFNMQYAPEFYMWPESFSEDCSTCHIVYNEGTGKEEIHEISFAWNYDSKTKEAVDAILASLPKGEAVGDGEYMPYIFKVNDLEVINYWLTCNEDNDNIDALINYSDEFKKYIGYKNFKIDTRMGDADYFYTFAGGIADFKYNGTVYSAKHMEVEAQHILYVPDDTANTPEAILAAAKKRIAAYVGEGKVKLEYLDTVFGVLDNENYVNTGEHLDPNEELQLGVDSITAEDLCFKATINELEYYLVIKRNSGKMVTPVYQNVDISSNISVSVSDASIPLDTMLEVDRLTEGDDYDRIIGILGVGENETFDIKLHSGSLDKYVTELENGKFEVKIPVPEKFKGKKNLIVYYVDENNTPIPYTVTIDEEENTVSFLTDHFSIYTLAEKTTQQTEHTQHSGGSATCCAKAVCSECAQPYGDLNPTNHTGGTELRNAKQATKAEKGYTGDTYCKGCDKKLAEGKEIPVIKAETDTPPQTEDAERLPSPQTGDAGTVWPGMLLALISGAMILSTILWKKKETVV